MRRISTTYRLFLLHLLQDHLANNGWKTDDYALSLSHMIDNLDAEAIASGLTKGEGHAQAM